MDKTTISMYKCMFKFKPNIDSPCSILVEWKEKNNENFKLNYKTIKTQNCSINFANNINIQPDQQQDSLVKILSEEIIQTEGTFFIQQFSNNQPVTQLKEIDKLNTQNISVTLKKVTLQTENKGIIQQREAFYERQLQLINKINELAVQNSNLQRIVELENQIKEKDEILNDYDSKIDENMSLKYQLSQFKNAADELLNQKNYQIQSLKTTLNNNITAIDSQSLQIEVQQKRLINQSLQNSIYELNDIIKKLKQEHAIELNVKNEEISFLKNQIQILNVNLQIVQDRELKVIQKELKMKENLTILEEQSRLIFQLIHKKQQIEQQQLKKIQQQQNIIQTLIANYKELELQLCKYQQADTDNQQTKKLNNRVTDDLNQEISTLKIKLQQSLNQTLLQHNNAEKNQQFQEKVIKLSEENKQLTQQKLNLQNCLQKFENQKRSVQCERISMQNVMMQLQAKIKYLEQQNINLTQSKIILQDQLLVKKDTISLLEVIQNKKQGQIEFFKDQILSQKNSKQQFNQLNQLIASKDEKIKKLEVEIQGNNSNSNFKIQNIDELREQHVSTKALITDLEGQIERLKTIIDQQEKTCQQLQQQKKGNETQNQLLRQHLQDLQIKLRESLLKLDISEKEITELKDALDSSQKINLDLKNQLSEKENQIEIKASNEQLIKNVEEIKVQQHQNDEQMKFLELFSQIKNLLQIRQKREQNTLLSQNFDLRKQMMEKQLNPTKVKTIKEKQRLLVMQFYKIKSIILKSIKNSQQRTQVLNSIKPSEKLVKEINQFYDIFHAATNEA